MPKAKMKAPAAGDLAAFAQESPAPKRTSKGREPFNSYLTPETAERLRVLAWGMSARERRRVSIAELVEKAVLDLLRVEEHGR